MKNLKRVAVLTMFLLAFGPSLMAQHWPMPTKKDVEPEATVNGSKAFPYSSPFADHVGRFVDSSETTDYLGNPRTFRAKGFGMSRANGSVYVRLGERFAVYKLNGFFTTQLGQPMTTAATSDAQFTRSPPEKYLQYNDYVDPEDPGQRLWTEVKDGQERLWEFDTDDRGYVYVAYDIWGWFILRDTGGAVDVVKQVNGSEAGLTSVILQVFKTGGKYYVATGDGSAGLRIWDVTNPSAPSLVRSLTGAYRKIEVSDGHVALMHLVPGTASMEIYTAAGLVSGQGPVFTKSDNINAYVYVDMATDGSNFYLAWRAKNGQSGGVYTASPSGATFTGAAAISFGKQELSGLNYHDGHLTLWGRDDTNWQSVWLYRGQGTSFEETDLGDFLTNYYSHPTPGYTTADYAGRFWDATFVEEGGKDYLVVSSYGLGDVYELEAPDRLRAEKLGAQAFYGDPISFRSIYDPSTIGVSWNFGNPESSNNIITSTSGSTVSHQYAGLTTAGQIQSPKTVSVTDQSDSLNVGTTSVSLAVPEVRALLAGSPLVSGSNDAVLGSSFADGSDGTVEGHYSVWTQDSVETEMAPDSPLSVGTCGPHTIRLAAHYVPYSIAAGVLTPGLGTSKHFIVQTPQYSYSVKPFVAKITAIRSGENIVFSNDRLKAGGGHFVDGNGTAWVEHWVLTDSSGGIVTSLDVPASVGSPGTFTYPVAGIPAGSKVTLTITMDPALIIDTDCQTTASATSTATMNVSPPDPVINVTGCANANASCSLTAISLNGQDTSGWTYSWKRDGVNAGNTKTIEPAIAAAGSYVFTVTATNLIGSIPASKTLNVEPATCAGPPVATRIVYHGATTGCTACTSNEPINFAADAWGYHFQDCDTFLWNFGDGSATSTLRNVTHTFPANGPYTVRLTVTNGVGSDSSTTQIQFGSVTPPPPTGCNKPVGAASPSYNGLTSGCAIGSGSCSAGETIRFVGGTWQYTVQSCDTFLWSFGDGTSSSARNPSHTYAASGNYNVRFTIQNSKGSIYQDITVPVLGAGVDPNCTLSPPEPSINYTGQTSGCTQSSTGCLPNEAFKFIPSAWQYHFQSCDEFLWDFGDGFTTTEKEPTHTFGAGEHLVKLTVHNKNGSATGQTTINLGPPAQKPVQASFTTTPARPKPGESVAFAATTTGGDPATQWAWNFGDGSSGSGKNVTHTYTGEGSFNVTLTASNSGGAAIAASAIRVSDSITYVLPIVVHADGANGSKWRSDLYVHVPHHDPNGIEIDADFRGVHKTLLMDASTEMYEDFLTEFSQEPGAGPVIISSPVPIQAWTRTYSVGASGVGTLGQLIPIIDMEARSGSVGVPKWHSIGAVRNDTRHRANLGIVNPNDTTLNLKVHMYEETFGLEVGNFTVAVPPRDYVQKNLSVWAPDAGDGFYSLRIDNSGGLPMTAYASIVDNISNDPVFVEAVEDGAVMSDDAKIQIVPGVGNINAWRTDLTIFNPDTQAVLMDVIYYERSGEETARVPGVVIPGKGSVAVEDVINSQYIQKPGTGGILQFETKSPNALYPIIFSSTYNDQQANGTFGHGIPAFSRARPNVTSSRGAIIPGARNDSSYYTNLGLVALHPSQTTVVSIALLDPISGEPRSIKEFALAPNASVIIGNVISDFLGSFSDRGALRVRVMSGGPVWAFATVIDQLTKDPEYVPAVPELD